ncbi:hypothetical protein Tco_0425312 [Tanacetum coccineum]
MTHMAIESILVLLDNMKTEFLEILTWRIDDARDGQHEVSYQVDVRSRGDVSEFYSRIIVGQKDRAVALEARVTVLETEVRRHEWQRQAADDLAVQHIMRTQGPRGRRTRCNWWTLVARSSFGYDCSYYAVCLIDQGVAAQSAEQKQAGLGNGYNLQWLGPRPSTNCSRECFLLLNS